MNCILSLQIQCNEQLYILLQGIQLGGGGLSVNLGVSGCMFTATPVPCHLQNSIRAFLPHQPKGLGDLEKFCSDIAFLLVSTKEGMLGDRTYGLSKVWVNPYQARVSTVEEAVKQLTTLVSSGPDWPYALVWLNGDTCHVPLPREGHLCILPEGGTSSGTCRRVSQLEVHQPLNFLQVVYPIGLNGHEIPLITSLPKSLANGRNLPRGEPIYLRVDILQSTVEGPEWRVSPPGDCPSILMASPIKATLPKVERQVSMTMEVSDLLSQVGLGMSENISENLTQKRLNPMVVLTPLPHKLGDPSRPVDTASQLSALDDAEMAEASLEKSLLPPLPQPRHQGPVVVPLPQMQAISKKRPTRP